MHIMFAFPASMSTTISLVTFLSLITLTLPMPPRTTSRSSRYVRQLALQCNIPHYKIIPLGECIKEQAHARRKYKNCISVGIEQKWESFIEGIADAFAAEGKISRSSAVLQLKTREESRHANREIQLCTKAFLGATYHMELPGPNGPFVSTDKEEIELNIDWSIALHSCKAI